MSPSSCLKTPYFVLGQSTHTQMNALLFNTTEIVKALYAPLAEPFK